VSPAGDTQTEGNKMKIELNYDAAGYFIEITGKDDEITKYPYEYLEAEAENAMLQIIEKAKEILE